MTKFLFNQIYYPNINERSIYFSNAREFIDEPAHNIVYENTKILNIIENITKRSHKIEKSTHVFSVFAYNKIIPITQKKDWLDVKQCHLLSQFYTKFRKLLDKDIIQGIEFAKYYGLERAETFLSFYFAQFIFPRMSTDDIGKVFYNNIDHYDFSDIEWAKQIQ